MEIFITGRAIKGLSLKFRSRKLSNSRHFNLNIKKKIINSNPHPNFHKTEKLSKKFYKILKYRKWKTS
jgi:hypothetical protein